MRRKPRLKPQKGYKYRLILCNQNNTILTRDIRHRKDAHKTLEKLLSEMNIKRMEQITGIRY